MTTQGPLIVLIANPHAARGRGRVAIAVAADTLRRTGARVDVRETAGPGDAARLATAAAQEDGVGRIAAVGGDGTLHEVANGLLSAGVDRLPPLGLIPVGGGNDYAKMLEVPRNDPPQAARILLEGSPRPVDVGLLEGADGSPREYFLNNVGLAYMAVANEAREVARFLPGKASYLAGGVLGMLRLKFDHLTVTTGEVTRQGRFPIVHVALGRYCGAGVQLTPNARLDDGQFEVYVLGEASKPWIAANWRRIERGDTLGRASIERGSKVRVIGEPGLLLHADGEIRHAPSGVVDLTLLPGALQAIHAN